MVYDAAIYMYSINDFNCQVYLYYVIMIPLVINFNSLQLSHTVLNVAVLQYFSMLYHEFSKSFNRSIVSVSSTWYAIATYFENFNFYQH